MSIAGFMRTGVLEPDAPEYRTVKHWCGRCGAEFHSPTVAAACCTQQQDTPLSGRNGGTYR